MQIPVATMKYIAWSASSKGLTTASSNRNAISTTPASMTLIFIIVTSRAHPFADPKAAG
jgi:hypothetical protein